MTEKLFPEGRRGILFSSDVLHGLTTTFGEGQTSKMIKKQIEAGIKCEEVFPETDVRCPDIAVVGINWRAGGLSDTVFVCNGEGTVPATLSRIESDLRQNGFAPDISINGHGRP